MDFEKYKRILSVNGLNHRERQVNLAKEGIIKQAHENPSYFVVEIGNKSVKDKREVLIIDSSKMNIKKIVALPLSNNEICAGDYVTWNNNNWLITQVEPNNEIYSSGLMTMCNYNLKWQDKNTVIFEYPVVIESNSKATMENNLINIGENQLKIYIRYDDNTKAITRGKRFFIDRNVENPKPYKVTNIDNVSYIFNKQGYIVLTVEEDVIDNDKDNIEMFVCDYKELVIPQFKHDKMSKIISNDDFLVCENDSDIVFDYQFIDNNKVVDNLSPLWNVISVSNDKLKIKEVDGKLYLSCDDYSMVGENVKIELSCKEDDEYNKSTIVIEVISMF